MISTSTYEDIASGKAQVARLAESLEEAANVLDARERAAELSRLIERINSDRLRVMFVGEFKRGKSTLINAMLGRKILPAWATPTTAIISEVNYGEAPSALVYHLDDPGTPIPVDVLELASFVTIDENDDNDENPYERAQISWPLELCRNGVSFWDSPGLNEAPRREEITLGYLQRADVLVFVFDCTAALSQTERLFLETRALTSGASDLFFVGNKINFVENEDERDRVRTMVRRKLGDVVESSAERTFFVNAKAALDGREQHRPELVAESGVPQLEGALERFLSDEPGRRRIAGAARLLEFTASELARSAEQSRLLLTQDRETLRLRYEQQREPLELLERRRDTILSRSTANMMQTTQQVKDETRKFVRELAEQIPGWAEEFTPSTVVKLRPFKLKQRLDDRVAEIVDHLSGRVQIEFARWQGEHLKPLIESRMTILESDVGDDVDKFIGQIETIRLELTLGDGAAAFQTATPKRGERAFAAATGFILTGGSGIEGAMFGFKGLGKSLLTTFGVGFGLAMLSFGPQAILIGMLGAGFLRGFLKLDKLNASVKEDVGRQVAEYIRSTAHDQADRLGEPLSEQLDEIHRQIDEGLEGRILELRREVENVLAEHDASERDVDDRIELLRSTIDGLHTVESEARVVFDALARI